DEDLAARRRGNPDQRVHRGAGGPAASAGRARGGDRVGDEGVAGLRIGQPAQEPRRDKGRQLRPV
ncbi:MAG: hypothetical protein AVDCRST_MAG78-892, partial [uncultured Rubrobacteraceae bacterium]